MIELPDVEAMVVRALASQEELADLDGRIYSVLPKSRTFPLARVYRYGGPPLYGGDPYWLDAPALQVDVWADGRGAAARLGETLRACCAQRLPGTWPEGIISRVQVSALVNSDDSTFSPAKPRFLFTLTLVTHPARAVPEPPDIEQLPVVAGAER